jgi:C1A family cysteine protease
MRGRMRATAAVFACAVAFVLVLAGAATAAQQGHLPQSGPLDQAFVESLHDPLAGVFGKRPAPLSTRISPAVRERLSARAATVLPSTYDLRPTGRLSPVRDQGDLGTCWAFANLASVESLLLPAKQWDFSEDNLVLRSGFGPFPAPYDAYSWGGWDFMAVAYLARWAGPVPETQDKYGDGKSPKKVTVAKHVQAAVMLPGRTDPLDNELIKKLVMENGALSVGMYYDSSFDSSKRSTSLRTPSYYCNVAAGETYKGIEVGENHGVDVVGWDDGYPAAKFTTTASGQPPGDGAFLTRNSWGRSYGDGGYVWVSYYDRSFAYGPCTSYSRVDAVSSYRRNYQYDTLGWTTSLGYPDVADPSIAWGANRFTAKASERVVAVGFYAPVAATGYQVWAGPTLGSLTLRGQGTIKLPGFATADLVTPLAVTKGKRFVVAVRLVTPGSAQPMAVEAPSTGDSYLNHAVAATGQSFMRYGDTEKWVDLAEDTDNPDANVCLKAYARK